MGGGTLRERFQEGPLAPADAAELLETLARAVHAAHEQGIIHRDLKPANILLDRQAAGSHPSRLVPKIADFGLAKNLDGAIGPEQTRTGAVLGTPSYMAPEQAAGHARAVGPAADVYALGAILYEALGGRPPFRAPDYLQTLEQVRTQEPQSLSRLRPGLPFDLVTICSKCLAKEPEKRYATAADLADDLRRFHAGEPILARPVPIWERALKWTRRHPAQGALAGLVLLAIAGALLGGAFHTVQLRREIERTQANYREARAVINQMLGRLEERSAAELPGLKELQRAQVEDALTFFERISRERKAPDPALSLDLAQAYEQAARVQAKLGRRAQADGNFRRALRLFEQLAAAAPGDADAQSRLADCSQSLGGFLAETTDQRRPESWSEEALSVLDRSLAIRQRLSAGKPANPRRLHDLLRSHLSLGQLFMNNSKRWAESESYFDRAFECGQALLREHPGVAQYRAAMVSVHSSRAWIYLETRRIKEADAAYTESERLLQDLVHDVPDDLDYRVSLATLYGQRASFYHGTDRPNEAVGVAGRAIALLEEMLRKEPTYVPARRALVRAYGWRVYANNVLHQYAQSAKDWDRIVALDDSPSHDFRRSERAVALGRAGDHARAAAAAEEVVPSTKNDPAILYNAACAYALAARAVSADTKLGRAERAARNEHDAGAAVALLQRLSKDGFFKDASVRDTLRGDLEIDLAPLRGRADFEALAREVLGTR
jgi:tetratricopeptide (TPR) repeat protein